MNRRLAFFFLPALFSSWAHTARADIAEVMHYWISSSEASAFSVFSDAFQRQGGTWVESAYDGSRSLTDAAYARIADGFPPTLMQWVLSPELGELVDAGVVLPLGELVDTNALSRIDPRVLELVTFDDRVAGVPVGLHGENWAFYNAEIMERFGFEPPSDWTTFFEQMEYIAETGTPTVAVGEAYWNRLHVFKAMLVSEGGAELMHAMLRGQVPETMVDPLEGVLAHFIRFRNLFVTSGVPSSAWNDATAAVMEGAATVQIMGDWAKGEFIVAGLEPGEDFICALAPGTDGRYILVVDTFVFPNTALPEDRETQQTLLEIMLTPELQSEFSRRKGAIPVVNDVQQSDLDACGRLGYATFQDKEGLVHTFSQGSNPALVRIFEDIINAIWDGHLTDPAEARRKMLADMAAARG